MAVGVDVPQTYQAYLLPDESHIQQPSAAEALAFELLNADRRRFGLGLLVRDAELDAVARGHSMDMRDNSFFGHYSDESGTPSDRLAAAGYRVGLHAENVASGQSLHGAQEGLMHSLGHRRNILQPKFTHVGIGVSGRKTKGHIQWQLTQLFAKPVQRVDANLGAAALRRRINAARAGQSLGELTPHGRLDAICNQAALEVAQGGGDGVANGVLAEAKADGLTKGGAYVWLRATVDLAAVDLPPQARSADYDMIGVGVQQLEDHPNGLIGVVLLFAGNPR